MRLAGEQSSQATAFHGWLHGAHPEIVSRMDVLVGNVRAVGMAAIRRLAYLWLRQRMTTSR